MREINPNWDKPAYDDLDRMYLELVEEQRDCEADLADMTALCRELESFTVAYLGDGEHGVTAITTLRARHPRAAAILAREGDE